MTVGCSFTLQAITSNMPSLMGKCMMITLHKKSSAQHD